MCNTFLLRVIFIALSDLVFYNATTNRWSPLKTQSHLVSISIHPALTRHFFSEFRHDGRRKRNVRNNYVLFWIRAIIAIWRKWPLRQRPRRRRRHKQLQQNQAIIWKYEFSCINFDHLRQFSWATFLHYVFVFYDLHIVRRLRQRTLILLFYLNNVHKLWLIIYKYTTYIFKVIIYKHLGILGIIIR